MFKEDCMLALKSLSSVSTSKDVFDIVLAYLNYAGDGDLVQAINTVLTRINTSAQRITVSQSTLDRANVVNYLPQVIDATTTLEAL